jgi:hypothetical protein
MMQVCSNLDRVRALVMNTYPDEITERWQRGQAVHPSVADQIDFFDTLIRI